MRRTRHANVLTLILAAGLTAGCGEAPDLPEGAAGDTPSVSALPIQVSAMVHIDPLPWDGGQDLMLNAYASHRASIQWYLELAEETGVAISAQMVGLYAEAAVRQGHEADFASFMPGGPHHLGTHLHAHVHGDAPYEWTELPGSDRDDPERVAQVFGDQIPWVNQVFEGAGGTAEDNWLFHGTHASYMGMQEPLLEEDDAGTRSYANGYRACGAPRGITYLYRGSCYDEPDAEAPFVHIPEVGGIIGDDQEHGPEGMVYGSLPYQRRDFLRVYLDWREGVRRGESQGVRHFTWMIHPLQLDLRYQSTDGRNPREAITELVDWLNGHFIDRSDDTEQVVAQYANLAEMVEAYEWWEQEHSEQASARSAEIADAIDAQQDVAPVRYLPAIYERLETTYHDEAIELDPEVVAHRFIDHDSGAAVVVLFARQSTVTLQLGGELPPVAHVLRGDGTRETVEDQLNVGPEPIIVETD